MNFTLVLVVPLLSLTILLLISPFFKQHHTSFRTGITVVSVANLYIVLICIWFFFVEQKTTDVVTELSVGSFFCSHPFFISNDFYYLNDVMLVNNPLIANYVFLFDSITITMLFVVVGVSCMVQLFSTEYMFHDLLIVRFFMFLNFFTLCMLVLVTAGSFVQMFVGWEGVGIASFLLIGFWFGRKQAVKCAIKAVIINRVGDCALLAAFSLVGFLVGDFSYFSVFNAINLSLFDGGREVLDFTTLALSPNGDCLDSGLSDVFGLNKIICLFGYPLSVINLIAFLICIGAFAKSAQFGLHTWLPDAMEGPTPVSALIHAATMVTAGVFLLIRCAPILVLSETALNLMILVGSLTAVFGASVAFTQFDIKKIIAYSTCSQLGYMVASCGLSSFDLSLFHLTTHAFFKAGLFMCAGLIIHSLNDEQDIRRFGGLVGIMPITYFATFLCSLCLGGAPFFSGFFSKDAIMEMSFSFGLLGWFSLFLLTISACLTVSYSVRLFYYVFWRSFSGSRSSLPFVHETPRSATAVLCLSFASVFLGFVFATGNYSLFFYSSAFGYTVIDSLSFSFFNHFWNFPFARLISLDFVDVSLDLFNVIHLFLPLIILFLLVSFSIFVWLIMSSTKQHAIRQLVIKRHSPVIFNSHVFNRHVFNFFSKAWLIDIFFTKSARVVFYINRSFIQRFVESGFFEFMLVLGVSRLFLFSKSFVHNNGSGRLSDYFSIMITTIFSIILLILTFV